PGELARIDDSAGNGGSMATHIFGECMHDDVSAVFKGAAQGGRRDGVVDDKRNTVAMCGVCQSLNIYDITGRITDGLAENSLGIVIDKCFEGCDIVVRCKLYGDALTRESVGEQIVSAAVQLADRNNVVAGLGNGLNGIGDGGQIGRA